MTAPRWSDLAVRTGSGVFLLTIGIAGVWAGGLAFHGLIAVVCALMVWELVRMITPEQARLALVLGAVSGLVVLAATQLPPEFAFPVLFVPALLGLGQLNKFKIVFLIYAALVLLAGFGLISVRDDMGFGWMVWLVAVVVVCDVAGYFAGRLIGGPKFWPRISPKKTWSGTAGGWIGAGLVGWIYAVQAGVSMQLIAISIAVAMASQIGDIAESAIKRQMNVKDSSQLIPGHGGVLDRFDGMLGASVFLLLVGRFIGFPPGLA